MDRFYRTGVEALISYGALIDRFMGDQVVGYFVPGFAGREHARQAVLCGLEILHATGHDNEIPWIPVGAGVHTGDAFVGSVGKGEDLAELTAIGDAANVGARLASVADIGELVVSAAAYAAAGLSGDAESRELVLKGSRRRSRFVCFVQVIRSRRSSDATGANGLALVEARRGVKMSEPIVFMSRNRVKESKLEEFKLHYRTGAEQLGREKPGTVAFLAYASDDGAEVSIFHVFPDVITPSPMCRPT